MQRSTGANGRAASRRNVLKGIGAGALGTMGVTGLTAAATENDIYVVASDDFEYSWNIADKMRDYAEEIFYDSNWNIHLVSDYDMSGAPTDDDGTYTKNCGNGEYGVWNWFAEESGFVSKENDCKLLMLPKNLYGGGCGGARTAVTGVKKGLWELAGPDSGEKSRLIGDNSNSTAFGEKAASIARCLHEIGHCYGAAHADGHIWVNNSVNRHSPLMLGNGQANNCGYDVNHCSWCDKRFLEGYAKCESSGMPHDVMDFSESVMENI